MFGTEVVLEKPAQPKKGDIFRLPKLPDVNPSELYILANVDGQYALVNLESGVTRSGLHDTIESALAFTGARRVRRVTLEGLS